MTTANTLPSPRTLPDNANQSPSIVRYYHTSLVEWQLNVIFAVDDVYLLVRAGIVCYRPLKWAGQVKPLRDTMVAFHHHVLIDPQHNQQHNLNGALTGFKEWLRLLAA